MVDVTVKQLAHVVGIPVERLLTQLQDAGISIADESQTVNEDQKQVLLNHLKAGGNKDTRQMPGRITLQRKSVSQVTLGQDSHQATLELYLPIFEALIFASILLVAL